MERVTGIVLAAGAGKRMHSEVHKQYMLLAGKPLLCYALETFAASEVDDIVLVTGKDEIAYCREEIIGRYGIAKVRAVVEGGKERYHSVYAGLLAAEGADYVLIHDGARPFVTAEMIRRSLETARECGACVVGMPVKDTIRVVGEDGFARETPDRNTLWQMQTPQTFSYSLIREAYRTILDRGNVNVTDDAMMLAQATGKRAKIIEGSYRNLKITTPEDLLIAEAYIRS